MPALGNFLKIDNQIGLVFGTVFAVICSANCSGDTNDSHLFENMFFQTDPDQSVFDWKQKTMTEIKIKWFLFSDY